MVQLPLYSCNSPSTSRNHNSLSESVQHFYWSWQRYRSWQRSPSSVSPRPIVGLVGRYSNRIQPWKWKIILQWARADGYSWCEVTCAYAEVDVSTIPHCTYFEIQPFRASSKLRSVYSWGGGLAMPFSRSWTAYRSISIIEQEMVLSPWSCMTFSINEQIDKQQTMRATIINSEELLKKPRSLFSFY